MSNELVRAAQKHVATRSDATLRREAGKGLVAVGGGGTALWLVAGALPLITFPMLLILSIVLGAYWWVKK